LQLSPSLSNSHEQGRTLDWREKGVKKGMEEERKEKKRSTSNLLTVVNVYHKPSTYLA
jgi:hypothetical protein